jgi:hypothetical protein
LPGSEGGWEGEGGDWEWGEGGEMVQTMYAHMNKWIPKNTKGKNKKIKPCLKPLSLAPPPSHVCSQLIFSLIALKSFAPRLVLSHLSLALSKPQCSNLQTAVPATCTCIALKVWSLDLHCALPRGVLFGFSLALAFLRPMYEVISQLCFLKPMLKFSVQTFNQPL